MPAPLPAIFFGHGNPLNALQRNDYTSAWANIGKTIARPKAVLAISAHWYLPLALCNCFASSRRTSELSH